jgi:hypothetical protein
MSMFLKIEQRATNCLTDSLLGEITPSVCSGGNGVTFAKIGIQRYEHAAVLNSEPQDLFVGRS